MNGDEAMPVRCPLRGNRLCIDDVCRWSDDCPWPPESESDWDAIAAEVGLPPNWRERGYDTAEYMEQPDSVYRLTAVPGSMRCPYPHCSFTTRKGVETMFRHVYGQHLSDAEREAANDPVRAESDT